MTPRTSIYLRRSAFAILFGTAATLSASAFGDPATACAAPREWDIGAYDACVARALADYQGGKSTLQDYNENVMVCCVATGGDWNYAAAAGGDCTAPFGEEAQEAERQPAPPPEGMTLWPGYTQAPPGPAAPPPSEAAPAP
jgi:hypothetical protein